MARRFTQHMSRFGRTFLEDGRDLPIGASTDMGMSNEPTLQAEQLTRNAGNVCYEVPSFHGFFSVGPEIPGASPHNPEFATAAGTRSAFLLAMDCAKGMAMTGYDILLDDEVAAEAWEEFRQEFRQ
jgi:hypothetical protein